MSVPPNKVIRVTPPTGGLHALATNRDYTTGAGLLTSQDLSVTTSGRLGVWMGHRMIVGEISDHGEVANEAAMLTLHDWPDDPHTRAVYHYVAPGDSCTRADDPGWRWHCMRGHGTALSDWERRPLAGALSELESGLSELESGLAGAQPLDADLTAIAEQGVSAWGLARLSDSGATAAKGALGIQRADIADTSAAGRALMAVGTPSTARLPRINADGSVTLIDVPSTGGGGMGLALGLRHWIIGRESDNAALDLVDDTVWTWSGTAATAEGKLTRALSFDGSSYISRQLSGDHIFQDGFTRVSWVKPASLPEGGSFLSSIGVFKDGHTAYQYQYPYSGVHQISGPISTDGVNDASAFMNSSAPLSTSGWTFVAQVYDPLGRAWSWRDADAISGGRTTAVRVYQEANPTIFVGSGSATDTRRWNGLVDSWAIWTRALTIPEIVWLWNAGDGRLFSEL